MKDITHYFADLPKKAESAPTAVKEVRTERAKIDEASSNGTAMEVTSEEPATASSGKAKRKRGRVKIKISLKSDENAVCDILHSSTDLVDKTPSPYQKKPKRRLKSSSDSPLTTNGNAKPSLEDVVPPSPPPPPASKKRKNSARSGDQVIPKEFADSFSMKDLVDVQKATSSDPSATKEKKSKVEKTEKLIELADKKGYSKRKIREEEEAAKIEKRLEKRKKLFTESNKNSEVNQSDENTPKNETPNTRRNNLLNYFSKSTPETLEQERQRNAKVTVKADIHTPSTSPVPMAPVFEKKEKSTQKKKAKSKQQEDADEIVIIQSETVILSPNNEKITSPPINNSNKPKWSLKIQLQSNHASLMDDEEIYTPTLPSKLRKENIKSDEKIPKILMPMKNKKKESNTPPESNSNNKTIIIDEKEKKRNLVAIKNEEKQNLKTDKEKKQNVKTNEEKEKSKTENKKLKTEAGRKTSTDSIKKVDVICDNGAIAQKEMADDDDCQIINANLPKKEPGKIAPLFKKKSKPSAEVTAARRLFLQSDIQENSNNNNNKETKKPIPVGPIVLPFPKISHVQQLSTDSNNSNGTYKFSLKDTTTIKPSYDWSEMKNFSVLGKRENFFECLYECVKSDTETVLSEIESYCPEARNMWKVISALTKVEAPKKPQRGRRKNDKKNSKQLNSDLENELLNAPWTDKYKPNSSAEVVGNEDAAKKLKSWLENWKLVKNNDDYSSSEEFYNSDCSSSGNDNNQVAVLLGPHGSGKTASVYAVAHELGYKVLEVNASSKRPGKKILKDFEEATKSHRVKKSDLRNTFVSTLKKSEETKKVPQNSLILLEDVDLVFEEDEGFVSAAFQLASNTKRPIVMTLRDTCFHLGKMAPQQLRISFDPAIGKRVTALMQLIALAETQYKLPQSCADALCQSGDLRKSLLQLQYLLSKKECISFDSLAVSNSSWNDMRGQIYKPAIKAEKKKKQTSDVEKADDNALIDLANNLDNYSLISTLMDIEDPTSNLSNLRSEPSMSFVENTKCYSQLEATSLEIGNWMNDSIKKFYSRESKKSSNQMGTSSCPVLTKRQMITGVDLALSQIASNTLDRRAMAVDYLSSIRTICRAEEVRHQLNSKRANRFFHYFQGSRLPNEAIRSKHILSTACKMLQDKSTSEGS